MEENQIVLSRLPLTIGLAALLAPLAMADEAAGQLTPQRSFTPADFSRFAPRTALDMVRQIPGFSISGDDDGSRGFGQASGNVLINGQRVSGKSNGARDALSRIPADNVERIDIVDGASLDIPGLSGQVANVVANASEGITGSWSWEGRVREVVRPYLDRVELSASGKSGNTEWSIGLEGDPIRGGAVGTERVLDETGALLEVRDENFNFIGKGGSVSGSLAWTPENGDIANLNASYGIWQPNIKDVSLRQPLDGSPQIDRIFQRSEDEWNSEIGGDYETDFGEGRMKIIGLYRFEHSPFKNRVFAAAVDASSAEEFIFNQTIDEAESILRAEYSWAHGSKHDWQIAIEGAFNMLESDVDEFEAFDFGPLSEDLSAGPAERVEEIRGEISATHGQKLTEKLTLQASISAEFSEISQSGTNETSQTFTRPKGFLSASYTVRDGYTLTGRIERKVGQLNFFDFIASSDLNNETGRDANPDLSPQQSWALELEAERDFGEWGAGSVKLIAEDIEDLVDRVPLSVPVLDGFGMPVLDGNGTPQTQLVNVIGNIDSAERLRLEFSGTINFDPIGLTGVQLEANGEFQETSLTDPLTGEERGLDDGLIRNWDVELRHDVPNTDWAWGIYAEEYLEDGNFFINEVSKRKETPPFGMLFVENKDVFGMTAYVRFGNIFGQGDTVTRTFFDPDRNGSIIGQEIREREFGDILTFGLEGSF